MMLPSARVVLRRAQADVGFAKVVNQCCYDFDLRLITSGSGMGTVLFMKAQFGSKSEAEVQCEAILRGALHGCMIDARGRRRCLNLYAHLHLHMPRCGHAHAACMWQIDRMLTREQLSQLTHACHTPTPRQVHTTIFLFSCAGTARSTRHVLWTRRATQRTLRQ